MRLVIWTSKIHRDLKMYDEYHHLYCVWGCIILALITLTQKDLWFLKMNELVHEKIAAILVVIATKAPLICVGLRNVRILLTKPKYDGIKHML